MSWWIKVRSAYLYLVAIAVATAVVVLFPREVFTFPTLRAGGDLGATHIGNVTALVPVMVWLWGLDRADSRLERSAMRIRRIHSYDALVVCAGLAVIAIVALVIPSQELQVLLAGEAALTGIAMIAVSLNAQRYAYLAPAGYLLVAVLFGFSPQSRGIPDAWAWILEIRLEQMPIPLATTLFGTGVCLLLAAGVLRWCRA